MSVESPEITATVSEAQIGVSASAGPQIGVAVQGAASPISASVAATSITATIGETQVAVAVV